MFMRQFLLFSVSALALLSASVKASVEAEAEASVSHDEAGFGDEGGKVDPARLEELLKMIKEMQANGGKFGGQDFGANTGSSDTDSVEL